MEVGCIEDPRQEKEELGKSTSACIGSKSAAETHIVYIEWGKITRMTSAANYWFASQVRLMSKVLCNWQCFVLKSCCSNEKYFSGYYGYKMNNDTQNVDGICDCLLIFVYFILGQNEHWTTLQQNFFREMKYRRHLNPPPFSKSPSNSASSVGDPERKYGTAHSNQRPLMMMQGGRFGFKSPTLIPQPGRPVFK